MSFVYLAFFSLAWVLIECLVGGTRLLFSLPTYGLISIAAILSLASIRGRRLPPNAFCLGSTLLLGAWVLIRSWYSPIEYLALPDFFMMLGCLMTYLLTVFFLNGILEQTIMIAVLWIITALNVWVGMVQFLKDPAYMLFGLMRPPMVNVRASGMYISPNNFAGFLVTVAVVSLSFGVWSRWRVWAKVLAIYVAFLCLAGVAISGSRGGYFATIGSLLCFAIGSIYTTRAADPRKFLPVVFGSLGGLVVVVAVAVFLMGHSEYLTRRMHTMVVKDVRIYNWEAALDHIKVSPWVGTGSGTHSIYGRLFRRPQIQADPVHAHCDYLELLAEYGAVGGLCMALFLTAHVRNGLRSFSNLLRRRLIPSGFHRSNSFAIQLGALCAVAGLAVHSLVDFDMHIPGNALLFAFLFGVIANPGLDRDPAFVDRLTPWARLLLPALGVFMLWRGIPLLPSEYCAEIARRSLRDGQFLMAVQYAQKGTEPTNPPGPGEEPPLLDRLLSKFGPNPKNPDLYFYMGEAKRAVADRLRNPYIKRTYFGEALAPFEAGLRVFPQDESMLVRYAQALDGARRYTDAEAIYQKAIAADPNLEVIRSMYETHLVAEGKKAEAEALARKRQESKTEAVDSGSSGDSTLK